MATMQNIYSQIDKEKISEDNNWHSWMNEIPNFLYSMRIVCENKKMIYLRWWWRKCDNQINGWVVILCVVTKTLKKYDVNLFHMNKIFTVNFIQRDLLGRENERQILWKKNKNRIIFVIVHFPSNKTILEDHSVGQI
jgi:hypothetical protein